MRVALLAVSCWKAVLIRLNIPATEGSSCSSSKTWAWERRSCSVSRAISAVSWAISVVARSFSAKASWSWG